LEICLYKDALPQEDRLIINCSGAGYDSKFINHIQSVFDGVTGASRVFNDEKATDFIIKYSTEFIVMLSSLKYINGSGFNDTVNTLSTAYEDIEAYIRATQLILELRNHKANGYNVISLDGE
jgi:hypothetical protein